MIKEANTDAEELRRLDAPTITNNSTDLTTVTSATVRTINAMLRASRRT